MTSVDNHSLKSRYRDILALKSEGDTFFDLLLTLTTYCCQIFVDWIQGMVVVVKRLCFLYNTVPYLIV